MENQIKALLDSGGGKELKRYIEEELENLKSIDNIKDISNPSHFALEVKAQRKAYLKLKEIFEGILDFDKEVKEKDPRDSYTTTVE